MSLPLFSVRKGCTVHRDGTKTTTLLKVKRAEFRVAEARSTLQDSLEYRLQIAWRRTDDAQHLRGRCLPLQRLGELSRALLLRVEQPRILDGDHGLVGKCAEQ